MAPYDVASNIRQARPSMSYSCRSSPFQGASIFSAFYLRPFVDVFSAALFDRGQQID
jgi:hypothetical protein